MRNGNKRRYSNDGDKYHEKGNNAMRWLQIPIIFAHGAKNINQPAIGYGGAAVPNVWRDNYKQAAIQLFGNTIDVELENSFN